MFIIFSRYYQPKKYRISGILVPVSAQKISAISAKTNIGRALQICELAGGIMHNKPTVCHIYLPQSTCGAWWLSGKFGALPPEGCRFKSHSSCHIRTQYQCCSQERF